MIESTQFDEKQDFETQFREYFNDFKKGYSAEEISRRKNVPLAIIEIKLKKACKRGDIAVDSRIEGVRYFKNLFLTVWYLYAFYMLSKIKNMIQLNEFKEAIFVIRNNFLKLIDYIKSLAYTFSCMVFAIHLFVDINQNLA